MPWRTVFPKHVPITRQWTPINSSINQLMQTFKRQNILRIKVGQSEATFKSPQRSKNFWAAFNPTIQKCSVQNTFRINALLTFLKKCPCFRTLLYWNVFNLIVFDIHTVYQNILWTAERVKNIDPQYYQLLSIQRSIKAVDRYHRHSLPRMSRNIRRIEHLSSSHLQER